MRPKRRKNYTIWGGTYLYGEHKRAPPPPPQGVYEIRPKACNLNLFLCCTSKYKAFWKKENLEADKKSTYTCSASFHHSFHTVLINSCSLIEPSLSVSHTAFFLVFQSIRSWDVNRKKRWRGRVGGRATLLSPSSRPPPYLSRLLTLRHTQLPKRLEQASCRVTEALFDLLHDDTNNLV